MGREKLISGLFKMLVVLVVLSLGSCGEEAVEFNNEEENTFESEENMEHSFDLVETLTNSGLVYIEANASGRVAVDDEISCANITLDGTKDAGRLEIDFGQSGCTGPDGKIRKGKIIIEYNGQRFDPQSVVYTVLNDFYVDGFKIEGTRKSTNITSNILNPTFLIEITNGRVVWPDETFALWNATRVHSWLISEDLITFQLSIDGVADGVTRQGKPYHTEIKDPLILTSNCLLQRNYLPSQGRKDIEIDELTTIIVDYGTGECDRQYTIQINNETKTLTL